MKRFEVAIIGAGAAGLAAARALRRRRRDVVVFEARDRIGGRILTRHERGVPLPIELGAEFIHGEAPETMRVVAEAGLLAVDVSGEHRRAERGRIAHPRSWGALQRVLAQIDPRGPDESFASFLARRPGGRSLAAGREAAAGFVRGFYAADLERISVHSLAPENGEPANAAAARSGRVLQGYDDVPRWLARDLGRRVRLRTAVTRVEWRRGRAALTLRAGSGGASRVEARAVLVTVPLGVLHVPAGAPGSLALLPEPPPIRRALDGLAMGSALRLVVWFRDFPWRRAEHRAALDAVSFLHTPGGPFNVWWTAHPLRAPMAVAWSGGPPAARLGRRKHAEIRAAAIETLARALGVSRRRVASLVRRTWLHDWDRDPWARGAYSYVAVGGAGASEALARPVEGTLFFAGEATDAHGQGTVEGAIASGLRAARQVDRSLSGS